jgi:hypothetical protein
VYYVNDIGYTSENLYTIFEITKSLVILQREFAGTRKSVRKFQIHINKHYADQVLHRDLASARDFSRKRKELVSSGDFPFSVGDKISWNNFKHSGIITEITRRSYIVNTHNRVWSLDPFSFDIVKVKTD